MLSSPHSPDSSSEEVPLSSSPPSSRDTLVSSPRQAALPEDDARASLALFEGHPDEEETPRTGESAKNGALDLAYDASIREFYSQLVSLLTNENAAPPAKPTN
ncbi:MAG: hypothetical protein JWP57_4708, partial [Spirosoma sp.]|nr:hypothetical protein [Spirosoma sp.]